MAIRLAIGAFLIASLLSASLVSAFARLLTLSLLLLTERHAACGVGLEQIADHALAGRAH